MKSPVDDASLYELASALGECLSQRRSCLVTAESCTGGWLAKAMTDVAGSSGCYLGGVVSYSNELKQALLGVRADTLVQHGAVSEQTAREMAAGALERLGGGVSVSVTGIAGPGGAVPGKPVGTVWFGWAWHEHGQVQTSAARECFSGDRDSVRRQSVARALEGVKQLLIARGRD